MGAYWELTVCTWMLVPFSKEQEQQVTTTGELFDRTSAMVSVKDKSGQLLPFVLHMSKYFKSRENITADLDFTMIDQIAVQIQHLLNSKSRMYYALNAYAAVKV